MCNTYLLCVGVNEGAGQANKHQHVLLTNVGVNTAAVQATTKNSQHVVLTNVVANEGAVLTGNNSKYLLLTNIGVNEDAV